MYTIIKKNSGVFHCIGKLQDGTEHWDKPPLEEAIASLKHFAKFMNGTKIKKKEITYLQEASNPLIPWHPFQ